MLGRFFKKSVLLLFLFSCLFFCTSTGTLAQTNDEEEDTVADESNLYTLMPMFLPDVPNSLNYDDLLAAMVQDQGYEAHCSGAQWLIEAKTWGDIDKFFSQNTPPIEGFYKGASGVFGGNDDYIVDFTTARIPVLRGMESKNSTLKNSSIEGMFGANFQTLDKNYMLNAAGISQNLLTSYQQCVAKAQNLISISKICAEIDGECTINKKYSIQVNGKSVSFKMLEILEWFSKIRPKLGGAELREQVCADITGGGSTDPNIYNEEHADELNVNQDIIDKTQKAIEVIPIDLDTLYRTAFLVLVPQQQVKDDDKFHFLQSSPQLNEKVHAPIFIAFKIPEFGTNKSLYVDNVDSLELSKKAIQTNEQNNLDFADQKAVRESNYSLTKGAQYIDEPIIKCPDSYPQCTRSQENALLNVLVDMINGAALDCTNTTLRIVEDSTADTIFNQEDQNWEKAGDLFTPANKDIKENLYKHNTNKETADKLGLSSSNLFDWQAIIDQKETDFGEPVVVNAYIVLPVGETIKDVNKSLAIFWDEEKFFDMIKTNVIEDMKVSETESKQGAIPKYYTIKGANVKIDAADIRTYTDSCEPTPILVPDENGNLVSQYICTNYNFGVSLQETTNDNKTKASPLFPDFGLGYMLRKIQQTIRATYDNTYNYIASCQRVEDMFLGRCSGDPTGNKISSVCDGTAFKNLKNMPGAEGIPQFAKDIFDSAIAPNLTAELIEAYEYAEDETGIPCEIAAGIHWVEGGLDPNISLHGRPLVGTIKDDALDAMKHLITKWPGTFDKNNMEYEDLVEAIAGFNGYGNINCSAEGETRWSSGGKCPAAFDFEDHPHPLGYIDERHSDMDLIFCLDYIEFNCNTAPTEAAVSQLRNLMDQKQETWGFSDETKEGLINNAIGSCFSNSSVCQSLSDGGKYPRFERPGSITTAILFNAAGQ